MTGILQVCGALGDESLKVKVSFCVMLVCKKWLPLGIDERGTFAR